jgi:hypothetical protein
VGRKRSGKRKYFLLCVAGLTFFSLLSCAPIRETPIYLEKEKPAVHEEAKPVAAEKESPKVREEAKPVAAEKENCSQLAVLKSIARHEDFETLLNHYQEMLVDPPKDRSADALLFSIGLLYAHPENPKKNYRKSAGFFKRVIKEYPGSLCTGEAKIWIGVLDDIEKAANVDLEIEQKKKELGK